MSYAGSNFKYLRKLRGWTQEDFANRIGIKRSLVGAYEEERAEPRLDVLETVGKIFKLTLDDLLLQDLSQEGDNYLSKRRRLKNASERNEITFVPVKAAAGYLAGYDDPEFIDELNTFTLPMLGHGSFRAFEIIGDSMLPTPSGSVIIGSKLENVEDVKTSHTYIVVSRQEGIVYKRIERTGRSKAMLTLVSDNQHYPPYTVDLDDVAEIWRAQLILQKPNEKPVWDVNQLVDVVQNLQKQVEHIKTKRK